MSRTPKNETPSDLARANGFFDLAKNLDEQPPPKPESRRERWLHSTIDREKAIEMIKMKGLDDGTFLIRESKKRPGVFVVSMLHDMKTYHFEVVRSGEKIMYSNSIVQIAYAKGLLRVTMPLAHLVLVNVSYIFCWLVGLVTL